VCLLSMGTLFSEEPASSEGAVAAREPREASLSMSRLFIVQPALQRISPKAGPKAVAEQEGDSTGYLNQSNQRLLANPLFQHGRPIHHKVLSEGRH